jgi:regulator of protease activity HflC (stomatin/prohibitin superfamily)
MEVDAISPVVEESQGKLNNAFSFIEQCFGNNREMLVFLAELTTRDTTTQFIAHYGNEQYYAHNEELKVDEIKNSIFERVKEHALAQYGICVSEVSVMKISLPEENLNSVFDQMTADRQKFIDQIIAEGQRLASEIMYEAEAEAAKIMAEGTAEAAKINAETEKKIAEIYASAQAANLELYKFLTQLDALSNSIPENSTMIVKKDQYPFDILNGLPADLAQRIEDAIKENNKLEENENDTGAETTDGGTSNG